MRTLMLIFIALVAGTAGGWLAARYLPGQGNVTPPIPDLSSVVESVLPSTVTFKLRENSEPFTVFSADYLSRVFESRRFYSAAGVCVAPNGIIATNAHVVSEFRDLFAITHDGRTYSAKPVAVYPELDLAFVSIPAELVPLQPCQSDKVKPGMPVFSVGTPFELPGSVSFGVVSALHRGRIGFSSVEDYIQTDAAINPGSSGGPLCDTNGKLVGVNSAIYSLDSRGSNGIGFAVPAYLLFAVLEKTLASRPVGKAWLGLRPDTLSFEKAAQAGYDSINGALVAGVLKGSPAENSGFKVGDVLISIDGKPIQSPFSLRALLYVREPGERVRFGLMRAGRRMEISVVLGENSVDDPARMFISDLSASVEKPDEGDLFHLGLTGGAQLDYIEYKGLAWELGLRSGDIITHVNGSRFSTLPELEGLVARAKEGGSISVTFIEIKSGTERKNSAEIKK
ncbi:MAG: serine protease HtrA [Planctomycetota bacterium]